MKRDKFKLIGFFVLLTFLIALPPTDANSTTTAEREALIALYNSTNGPDWINNSGWLGEEGTECSWFGVWCFVNALELSNNGLKGSIPQQIGELVYLRNLHLSNNQLSGSIPPEIGNLINLIDLYLDNNQLTGDIPSEIGNLTSAIHIDLHNNKLTGSIPSTFTGLTELQWIYVAGNCLTNFDSLINVMSKWGPPVLVGADAQRCSSGLPWLMLLLDDTATDLPDPPSELTTNNPNSSSVNLNWIDASNNEIGFSIHMATTQFGNYSYVESVSAGTTSYLVSGLAPSTTYWFKVKAYSSDGESDFSNIVSITTTPAISSEGIFGISQWGSGDVYSE